MFRNYFKTAWRNLVRNRVYSALNILGLATGMAVALIIGFWVWYQYSYDRFLPGYEQAFKVRVRYNDNGQTQVGPATCRPLAAALRKDVPGIRYVAQTDWMGPHNLVFADRKLYITGAMAEPDFLRIFQYPLLTGKAGDVLQDMYSIVLTESTAKALFGTEDPMNKMVTIDNVHDLKVTGILKDLPGNSTLAFNFLVPFSYYEANFWWVKKDANNWRDNSFQTFAALQPNASYAQVDQVLKGILKKYNPVDNKGAQVQLFSQPLSRWHLYADFKNGVEAGGFIEYVKIFGLIAILVLLIACINFTNLSTARSEKRAKEVGIRKAMGSQRSDLIFQFLIESLVITAVSSVLASFLVWLSLPAFNILTHSTIDFPYTSLTFWGIMAGYVLATGLLAGSRPALYLSSFRPVKVLKGALQPGRAGALPRQVLVVLQFTCSIALIISTIIVYQQIQYAKDRPMGYDANRLMMTDASDDLNRNYDALKNDLLQSGVVSSVTRSSSPATDIWSNQRVDNWSGKFASETLGLATIGVCDADYFKTLGLTIKDGHNFLGDVGKDSLSVLLNEAAVQRMRYKEPIGQIITWHDVPQQVRVIGVVKDALMISPFSPAAPTIFIYSPYWSSIITYRLSPTVRTQDAIAKLTGIFSKYNPSNPYIYHFVDETYAAKFALETLIGTLSALFSLLAVLISCLGLFGLAAYIAEQRTKEIGIRKVLGASVSQVWLLLSKDFILLVVIACVIATPVAFYFSHNWLLKYNYRITIGPGVFIISGSIAVLMTVVTISFQAIKAALMNPAKSLRSE